jgi:trehalose/maltose hydrolase-like predicted phosphorylase
VCKVIKKSQKQLLNDDTSVSTLFYLTRIHNLYTCDSLSTLVPKVTDFLTTKVQTVTTTSDIYFGHLLAQHSTGIKEKVKNGFYEFIKQESKKDYLSRFNKTDLSIAGSSINGLSLESMQMLEVLSVLVKKDIATSAVKSFLETSVSKLLK